MADCRGNLNLFTTEEGMTWLNSPECPFGRSSGYLVLHTGGEIYSLIHGELDLRHEVVYGVGSARYRGALQLPGGLLEVEQHFLALPDLSKAIHLFVTLHNPGQQSLRVDLEWRSDQEASGGMRVDASAPESGPGWSACAGDGPFLTADGEGWKPCSVPQSLRLRRACVLPPGERVVLRATVGYGKRITTCANPPQAQAQWRARLANYRVAAPEPWMEDEIVWDAGQLLSFTAYDSSVEDYFIALGGYGWPEFGVRETAEMSIVLAECDWDLAVTSLRYVAKTQLASGDIPKIHTMRRDRPVREFESDNEIWLLLAAAECVNRTGHAELFDQPCPFWDHGESVPLWEHLRRAFRWLKESIGLSQRGLVLIREGDWNDYLSRMGAKGEGDSVMNSAMACRACDGLIPWARRRGDLEFASELEQYLRALRVAVGKAFDSEWFLCGYTDDGKPVGSFAEDRLYLNAQSWAALGRCGTPEQRRTALRHMLEKCHTDIGLILLSRPFSSPPPDDIAKCPIPRGEGENGGIWPQTIYWAVWALAEEGMVDEALAEWVAGTLRHHARRFPGVPYGIFNGPDCFSSKWAGSREGCSEGFRVRNAPMVPMVAWQGFAMRCIEKALKKMPVVQRGV